MDSREATRAFYAPNAPLSSSLARRSRWEGGRAVGEDIHCVQTSLNVQRKLFVLLLLRRRRRFGTFPSLTQNLCPTGTASSFLTLGKPSFAAPCCDSCERRKRRKAGLCKFLFKGNKVPHGISISVPCMVPFGHLRNAFVV